MPKHTGSFGGRGGGGSGGGDGDGPGHIEIVINYAGMRQKGGGLVI